MKTTGKVLLLALLVWAACMLPLAPAGTALADDPAGPASGTVYYVDDANGDDANDGTSPQTAWRTLNKVNATVFQPGDAILFRAGGVWTGKLHPKGSGSEGQSIRIDKYGEGPKPLIAGGGVDAAIYFYNQEYWEVRNLEITNDAPLPGERRGIHVSGDSGSDWNNLREYRHFVFENLDIHSVRGQEGGGWHTGGIIVWGPNWNYAVSDVIIRNNNIYSLDSVGVYLNGASRQFSSGNKIQNNVIYDIAADGAILLNTTNGVIEHNTVFDTHKRAGGYHVPLWTWGTLAAKIQYNEVFNTYPGGDAMAYDSDYNSVGTIIQYNYSHNNAGGFVLTVNDGTNPSNYNRDTVIRYNISQNDRGTIFTLAGPTENTTIYNNTIYIPEYADTRVVGLGDWGGYPSDTYFYNNILVNLGSGGYSFGQSTNYVFDHNLFYGNHPADVLAMDANKVTADPLLAAPGTASIGRDTAVGYQLLQGSPAIGAGRIIPDNGGLDYWSNPVPADAPPNIGAYEGPGLEPANLPPLPSSPEDANLLANPGFEAGSFEGWSYYYNGVQVTQESPRSGDYAARLTNGGSGFEQTVTDLKPNTMYRLAAYGRSPDGGSVALGVKNYGYDGFKDVKLSGSAYARGELFFQTGSDSTSAVIYLYKSGSAGTVYVDDVLLFEYGEVPAPAHPEPGPDPVFVEGESDDFNAASLDGQWTWIRENGANWSLGARPGYLRIISEAGDIVDGQATARNILLTGAPEGNWTIETRMIGKPTSRWSQGGLIVYDSDRTYLRLTRLFGDGNQIQFTRQIDAVRDHAEVPDTIESPVLYLRIVKQGSQYSGYYSEDGIMYTQVWTTQTAELAEPKVGLIVCAGTGLVADFDYFRIIPHGADPVPVASVAVDPAELTLHVGEEAVLSATVSPADASEYAVLWSTSNPSVVQAHPNGTITAMGVGTAVVTVTTADGGKTDSVAVEVLPPPEPGSQNIAPIAALSASSSHENGSHPPQKAVDGIRDQDPSRWITDTTTAAPHWLLLEWDRDYEIDRVLVWSGFNGLVGRQIADFEIQYWDGSGWQTAASVTNNPQDGRIGQYNELTFPAVTTSKVRMYITRGSAYDQIARLFEIEVWGKPVTMNIAPLAALSASSVNGAYTPDKAVDGIKNQSASRWMSDPALAEPHWLQLEWDRAYTIGRVNIWSGFPDWVGSQLADFEIQYWDGSGWQTAVSVTGNTQDVYYGQYNELYCPAVMTDKLRLYITRGSDSDSIARLCEIEVWF